MKRKIIVKGMLIGMILLGAAGCGKGGEEEGSVNTSDITGAVDGNGEENKENPDDVTPEPTKVGIPPVPTLTPEPTKASEPASDGESSIEDTRTKEEIYNDMIARSFLSAGNNYRVKKVLEKARNGEDVLLAYIGGSITEGANATDATCYVSKSYDGFVELTGSGEY